MNICTLNKIAACGTDRLAGYTITDQVDGAAGVLVRSAAMHDMDLPDTLLGIARAGAGVNNIPIDKCSEQGIVVFNTPGANANSVMELALCGMLLASRDIVGGINWVQTIKDEGDVGKKVEKGKSKFAGFELAGKKLGVILHGKALVVFGAAGGVVTVQPVCGIAVLTAHGDGQMQQLLRNAEGNLVAIAITQG